MTPKRLIRGWLTRGALVAFALTLVLGVASASALAAKCPTCSNVPSIEQRVFATETGADVLATPAVENAKLQNVVNDLYKGTTNPSRVGLGTTADAVRNEIATGQATGGTFHLTKAEQYSNALSNLLKTDLGYHDRLVAQSLLDDLQNALRNTP